MKFEEQFPGLKLKIIGGSRIVGEGTKHYGKEYINFLDIQEHCLDKAKVKGLAKEYECKHEGDCNCCDGVMQFTKKLGLE